MKQNVRNIGNDANRIIGQLAIDKKKTIFAVCLIVLMVFMWVKVFIRKSPASAQAATDAAVTLDQQADSKPPVKVAFIELPVIAGRHDIINRNFFSSNGWREFLDDEEIDLGGQEVNIVSKNGEAEEIKKVAEKLRLEAIWMGSNTQAYINNKLLTVADELSISDGVQRYEFEVVTISENAVVLRCREAEVMLKLP